MGKRSQFCGYSILGWQFRWKKGKTQFPCVISPGDCSWRCAERAGSWLYFMDRVASFPKRSPNPATRKTGRCFVCPAGCRRLRRCLPDAGCRLPDLPVFGWITKKPFFTGLFFMIRREEAPTFPLFPFQRNPSFLTENML